MKPVSIVVLVDESGSINAEDLRREREAATTIALGEFAPLSRVSVVGFGSDDGGQSPVDVVCPPVEVGTGQDQQALAECVGELRKRRSNEGNGTDHYAAFQQAMTYLAGREEPKMIFLLTDGKLDVAKSPRYGPDNVNDQRNKAALRGIDNTLVEAREQQVQVWPLGFGKVNKGQLDSWASAGAQGSCGSRAPKPSATVVANSSTVADVLLKAFRAARCAGSGEIQHAQLAPGESESVKVKVPEIATDGSIVVVKRDFRVSVEFRDPENRVVPKDGPAFGSTFQGSGANGPVEALRVVNPIPGEWTVVLTSAPDVPALEVSAVVIWQGAVRAMMTVDPPSPQKGQQVRILLSLQTRNRPIRDADQLSTLDFTVAMKDGDETVPVSVSDSGQNGDQQSGDGMYTGEVTIPETDSKSVKFVGSVGGIGISGDTRTVVANLSTGRAGLAAQILVPAGATVEPGKAVEASVVVSNLTGAVAKVRVQIDEVSPGTRVSVRGARTAFDVPAAGNVEFPFDVVFAKDTALGANSLVLKLTDESDTVLANYPLSLTVGYPPAPPPLWLYIGLPAVLLLGATALAWHRARQAARDVRGLAVYLSVNGRPAGDIAAPEVRTTRFRFAVRADGPGPAYLDEGISGGDPETYTVTRVASQITLHTPGNDRVELRSGAGFEVGHGVLLEIRDERAVDPVHEEPGADEQSPPDQPVSHDLL